MVAHFITIDTSCYPMGHRVVGGYATGAVCIYDLDTGQLEVRVQPTKSAITEVRFLEQGQVIAHWFV